MKVKFHLSQLSNTQTGLTVFGKFVDVDTDTVLGVRIIGFTEKEADTTPDVFARAATMIIAQAVLDGYTITADDIMNYYKGITTAYVSGVKKEEVFDYVSSATVAGGVATFYLTHNGAVGGNAVFSEVFASSIQAMIDDAANVYNFSNVTVAGDKKSITMAVKRIGLALGVIVYTNAANGTVVNLTVKGK